MPAAQFLYLTTIGRASGEPREIEIWFTQRDGRFYVIAEYETSHWVQNLRANPQARWRESSRIASHAQYFSAFGMPVFQRVGISMPAILSGSRY